MHKKPFLDPEFPKVCGHSLTTQKAPFLSTSLSLSLSLSLSFTHAASRGHRPRPLAPTHTHSQFRRLRRSRRRQGTLTEREGSVQLTSLC
jgi:hypothetical protein